MENKYLDSLVYLKIINRVNGSYVVYNLNNVAIKTFQTWSSVKHYYSERTMFVDYAQGCLYDRQTGTLTHDMIFYIIHEGENSATYGCFDGQDYNIATINGSYRQYMFRWRRHSANYVARAFNRVRQDINNNILERQLITRNRVRRDGSTTNDHRPSSERITARTTESTTERVTEQLLINRNLLMSYHTTTSLEFKSTNNDLEVNNKRFFGFEIEVDKDGSYDSDEKHRVITKLHQLLNNNNQWEFCKFERDGSLSDSGFEIITQPMTYDYLVSKKEQLKQAMSLIMQAGFSSHDNGRCGLHIHVSRTELPDDVLEKVILVFENFKNELIAFSRRTESGMRWSRFISDNMLSDTITPNVIKRMKDERNINSHNVVINNNNANTVEFRLFRGTLNYTTFMAAAQLIDNIITICRIRDNVEKITWNDIINFNSDYTELVEYNTKRNIFSTHELKTSIGKIDINTRAVILVRPFQISVGGDN